MKDDICEGHPQTYIVVDITNSFLTTGKLTV